jgi:hypothetical protein
VRLHEISAAIRLFMFLAAMGHLPIVLRSVIVSPFVSAAVFGRLRADARARRETRQTVRRSLTVRLLGGDRTPPATADLLRSARPGVLGQAAVQGRAAHFRHAHQLTDFGSLVGSHA